MKEEERYFKNYRRSDLFTHKVGNVQKAVYKKSETRKRLIKTLG